jgi:transaldolase
MATTNPLAQLSDQGVAVWVDSIARDWIQKGELRRLRDQFQVAGVTSNPTIFQKAMGEGSFYDDDIARLAGQGLDARRIFESLALDDIRAAAADMEPVWERTGGVDGRVSFEVPPDIADDTEATIRETRRLFDELARPNVFIKIPATAAGVPAIRASIAAGINVNVTLVFSVARYREVVEAYLSGLEELAEAGALRLGIAASLFVPRAPAPDPARPSGWGLYLVAGALDDARWRDQGDGADGALHRAEGGGHVVVPFTSLCHL